VKEFLSQKGITWTEKYVDSDRAAAIEMIRRSGQQGVPVTVIGDEVVVGFDRPRLERIIAAIRARPTVPAGRKSLGAKVADASRYSMPGGTAVQGAYVGGVKSGTPAEAAGLKVGDVIVAVDGKTVNSVEELSQAISGLKDVSAKLSVARGPSMREVMVKF
jgi:S1-C subfamily serine protease